ncbi:SAGA-associated factor 29 isoform X2 [Belonocnema kinseyi]|uniref:SAGA-associated factor 29 isoform X2 n=1 Tax=Belonocnema kinseyi TaxID=2817044 RepID=UPI00143E0C83|nr:SAGA-associated factor 29 isoform X2 [Belonocnema kinseyi]
MPFNTDAAAHQIQDRLKSIYSLVHDFEKKHHFSENNLSNIIKTHDKLSPDDRVTPYYQQKLKAIYIAAISDATSEEDILRKSLDKINEIRFIRNERRIQMGDMVAALVKGSEEEENWILAEVVSFNATTNKYEVDDIDEEQKDRHTLSRRRVVPLPLMRANPETDSNALFPKESIVMALYPQTTCFYKAVVNQLPTTATEEYEVLFEDANYADGYSPPLNVAQRYVISIKESKKNKGQS